MLAPYPKNIVTAVSLALLLSACGGGGGGSGNSPSPSSVALSSPATGGTSSVKSSSSDGSSQNTSVASSLSSSSAPPTPSVAQRIPVGVNARLTPDLFIIDSARLDRSFTLETNLRNGFFTVPLGDYNATTKLLSNVRPGYAVYIKSGRLFKVNLGSALRPAPEQLSSETQAANTCADTENSDVNVPNIITGTPSLDGLNTILFYKALVGGNCVERAVNLSMSASDAPITLGNLKILVPFINSTTGVIAGFFATQGAQIGTVDNSLAGFTPLANFSNVAFVNNVSERSALLYIDGTIRRFDYSSKVLSSTIISFPPNSTIVGLPDADTAAYYFSGPQLNTNGSVTGNTSLYKITDASSPLISTLYTSNQTTMFLQALTPTKAVIFETSGYSTVNKTGGAAASLNVPNGAFTYGNNNERVFYSQASFPTLNLSKFGSLLTNNTGGVELADTWPLGAFSQTLGLSSASTIDQYIAAEFANDRSNYAKAKIYLVSGLTGQKSALLGTIPDINYADAQTDSFRFGAIEFCTAVEVSGSVCDAYYYSPTAGSLTRMTTHVP